VYSGTDVILTEILLKVALNTLTLTKEDNYCKPPFFSLKRET
jgi:hypothetical protein